MRKTGAVVFARSIPCRSARSAHHSRSTQRPYTNRSGDHQHRITMTPGGETRFHSVKNGLAAIQAPGIVFVHDAVRCLLTTDLIHRCYERTVEKGNAIPAIQPIDTLRIETPDGSQLIDRSKVRIIQTPQTFYSDIIKKAFEQPYDASFTDEASVVEKLGVAIQLIEGEATNIKITRPLDILLAEKIIAERTTQ
jgi:2-C-methyl-D-erythritol 4-phosphate cytidylyltransferase